MKQLKPLVEPQIDMVEDRYGIMRQRVTFKTVHICKWHTLATAEDMIKVVIKNSNKTVERCRYCERRKEINKLERKKILETEKKNLTDYYLRKKLTRGSKLAMHEIPEPLIAIQRTAIQIERLKEKIEAPLKKCDKHGKLYIEDVIKSGKNRAGVQQYKCRLCMKDMHKRHYEMNKLIVKEKHKKYREENKEKVKEIKKASFQKHSYKYLDRENNRKRLHDLKGSKELSDRYVKKLIVKRTSISMADVPAAMIDCMRAIQQLKRTVKSKKTNEKLSILKEKINDQD